MTLSLQDLSKKMRDIDFTMLSTRAIGGEIAGRPMSNNGDVEYDGDSWFFAMEDTTTVKDIERDPKVGLSLQGSKSLLGAPASLSPSRPRPRSCATRRRSASTGSRIWSAGSTKASTRRAW